MAKVPLPPPTLCTTIILVTGGRQLLSPESIGVVRIFRIRVLLARWPDLALVTTLRLSLVLNIH